MDETNCLREPQRYAPQRRGGKKKSILRGLILGLVLLAAVRVGFSAPSRPDPDRHYEGCRIASSNCVDAPTCALGVLCGPGNHQECRVYDCGADYGVYTLSPQGETRYFRADKPPAATLSKEEKGCRGQFELLSQDCQGGYTQIRARLSMASECAIDRITVVFEGAGAVVSTFADLGGGDYAIISDRCGNLKQVILITTSGAYIPYEV